MSWFIRAFQHLEATEVQHRVIHLGRELEAADDQDVEGVARLAGGVADELVAHRVIFRADGDGGATSGAAFLVASFEGDITLAGPRLDRVELEPLAFLRILHACGLEMLHDHLREVGLFLGHHAGRQLAFVVAQHVKDARVVVGRDHAVRRQTFDGEGSGDAGDLGVVVGLVVQELRIAVPLALDGGVDGVLPDDAGLPKGFQRLFGGFGPWG